MTELYGNDGATGGGNAAEAANPRPNGAPVEGDGRPVSVSAVSYTHLTLPTICSV